jgi:shikimate dehydrogenase
MNKLREFGLIGYPLGHSYSEKYFNSMFAELGLDNFRYHTFSLTELSKLNNLVNSHKNLFGLNVTTPYKEHVIPYLSKVDQLVLKTGVVNTIIIHRENDKPYMIGYNTDVLGVMRILEEFDLSGVTDALILGSSGSAKTVSYVLKEMGINSSFVSRFPENGLQLSYNDVQKNILLTHRLIVNATPVGMFPNINNCPDIPYEHIGEKHICVDLVYNPAETLFLKKCKEQNAQTTNGLTMLYEQANKAWDLWKLVIEHQMQL